MRSRTGFVSRAPASLHRMSPAAAPDALPLLDAYRADHDVAALVARLEGLDAAGSLLTTAAPGAVLSALRPQEDLWWSPLPLVVACHLPSTPAQVAGRLADAFLTGADGDLVGAYARRRMEGRGREWCAELVGRVTARSGWNATIWPLLHRLVLAHDLEPPDSPEYWRAWCAASARPRPGTRWAQCFAAACAAPGALGEPAADPDGPQAPHLSRDRRRAAAEQTVRCAMAGLRRAEDVDDDALTGALVGVFERGDRPGVQRAALAWLRALDLEDRLALHRDRLIGALPQAHSSVVIRLCPRLLEAGPDDEALTSLALTVLARPERTARRMVLRALTGLDSPGQELVEQVRELVAEPDVTTARLASRLLSAWAESGAGPAPLGLWREPEPRPPAELAWSAPLIAADPPWLSGLLGSDRMLIEADRPSEAAERLYAQLVAVGFDLGAASVARTVLSRAPAGGFLQGLPLLRWARSAARGRPFRRGPGGWWDDLDTARAVEALNAVGRVPCLLSTPTHGAWRLSWPAFVERVRAHERAGAAPGRCDLLSALDRLDRVEAEDLGRLPDLPVAGTGTGLLAALRVRALANPGGGSFELREGRAPGSPRVPRVRGDEPACLDLLGLRRAWRRRGSDWFSGHPALSAGLLPTRTLRPAAMMLRRHLTGHRQSPGSCAVLIGSARRVHPALVLLALHVLPGADAAEREELASALLGAWEDGRLRPDALVEAWRGPWRDDDAPLDAPAAGALLVAVARAGALALVWPALRLVAEDLAATSPMTASASAVLESLTGLLPDVIDARRRGAAGAETRMPAIRRLAAGGGGNRAVRSARVLVGLLDDRPDGGLPDPAPGAAQGSSGMCAGSAEAMRSSVQ